MSESSDMKLITDWREWMRLSDWRIGLLMHVPMGGLRHPRVAKNLKREGAQAGFPDWVLPVPNVRGQILFIEQKVKGGRLTEHQQRWFRLLKEAGHVCQVSYSAEETIGAVIQHLK